MSINTADFLCQCIVHVLGITLLFCFTLFVCLFIFFWGGGSVELSQPTGLCTEPEIVSRTLSGLFLFFFGGEITDKRRRRRRRRMREKKEILDYFGGLVLDCITTVSGVQSVIAECSLYICVHSILQDKKQ